jgi:hypothetical protein
MPLPRLTHRQFLVISILLADVERGRDVRSRLRQAGVRQTGPAFYQMMATLEDGGLVAGRYEQEVVDGQIIRQRHYKVQAAGKRAWMECRDFYAQTIGSLSGRLAFAR